MRGLARAGEGWRGLAMCKYADAGHYGNNSEDTNVENRIKVNK